MTRQTTYLVQAFVAGRGQAMKAERPTVCKTPEQARSMAERIAPTKIGVVAYSTSADAETGDYDDQPTILFKAGRLPEQFEQ